MGWERERGKRKSRERMKKKMKEDIVGEELACTKKLKENRIKTEVLERESGFGLVWFEMVSRERELKGSKLSNG